MSEQRIQALQRALAYYMPHVPHDEADPIFERTIEAAMLLVGYDGPDEPSWGEQARIYAERYRWLRGRDIETISQGGVFAGLTPENVVLNGDDLDDEVDKAMLAESVVACEQEPAK